MGRHIDIHCGVYIIVDPILSTKTIITKVCKNHPNNKFKNEVFCPICRDELLEDKKEVEDRSRLYNILHEDKYEDMFIGIYAENIDMNLGNKIVLISKCDINNSYGYSVDEDGDAIEIKSEEIEKMKVNFRIKYKDVLEVLLKRSVSIEYKFGLLVYYR